MAHTSKRSLGRLPKYLLNILLALGRAWHVESEWSGERGKKIYKNNWFTICTLPHRPKWGEKYCFGSEKQEMCGNWWDSMESTEGGCWVPAKATQSPD